MVIWYKQKKSPTLVHMSLTTLYVNPLIKTDMPIF
jgi:hypothetical protein